MPKIQTVRFAGDRDLIKKRKNRRIILAAIVALILLALLILNSNIFSLKTIEITGNEQMSDEEVKEYFGLTEGVNLFRFFLNHIGKKVSRDPRIENAEVYVNWPDGVKIEVKESVTVGYVYFQGTYLCLSRDGAVVDSTYYLSRELPILKGLNVKSFSIGQVPVTEDESTFKTVMQLGSVLKKYGLTELVREMNVHDLSNIVLYTDNLDIYCGGTEDFDMKAAVIQATIANSKTVSGILHVEDLEKQIYIEPKV